MKVEIKLAIIFLVAIFVYALFFMEPIYFDLVDKYKFSIEKNLLYKFEVHRYPAFINVTKKSENLTLGLSIDPNVFNFGKIPLTEEIKRVRKFLTVSSLNDSGKVKIYFFGNISKYLKASENNFYINKNQNKTIEIWFEVSKDLKEGYYFGEIRVLVIIPKYG